MAQAQKRVSFPVVLPRWKESPKIASVQVTITADKPPNRGLFIRWEDERQLSVGLADPVDFRQFPDSWLGPNAEIVTLHDVDVLLGVHPPGEFMRRDWIQSAGAQWYANGLQWTLVAPLSRDEMVESLEDLIGRAA